MRYARFYDPGIEGYRTIGADDPNARTYVGSLVCGDAGCKCPVTHRRAHDAFGGSESRPACFATMPGAKHAPNCSNVRENEQSGPAVTLNEALANPDYKILINVNFPISLDRRYKFSLTGKFRERSIDTVKHAERNLAGTDAVIAHNWAEEHHGRYYNKVIESVGDLVAFLQKLKKSGLDKPQGKIFFNRSPGIVDYGVAVMSATPGSMDELSRRFEDRVSAAGLGHERVWLSYPVVMRGLRPAYTDRDRSPGASIPATLYDGSERSLVNFNGTEVRLEHRLEVNDHAARAELAGTGRPLLLVSMPFVNTAELRYLEHARNPRLTVRWPVQPEAYRLQQNPVPGLAPHTAPREVPHAPRHP